MEQKLVYRKTARGAEAIATRDGTLAPRERSMLIMVDGRKASAELAALTNAAELLASLAAKGLIEPVPRQSYAATQPAPLEEAATRALSVSSAQRLAVRRLTELLGPHATDMCLRVEKARNAQELVATFRQVEGSLRQAVGASAAARWLEEVGNVQGA